MTAPGAHSDTTAGEARLVFALAGRSTRITDTLRPHAATTWSRLLRVALEENAIVALRDYCHGLPPGTVPEEVARQVAIFALHAEQRMHAVRRRLEETLVAMNAVGIEPLLLKGAALTTLAYGAWNRRPMRDIDLLVRERDLGAARAAAIRAGWVADRSVPGEPSYETHHHLAPLFDGAGTQLRLEIHRSLVAAGHPFAFSLDDVQARARPVTIGAGRAHAMCGEYAAVHLAVHFVWSHQVRTGGWHAFRDLASLLHSGALQWEAFIASAKQWRAATCAYWTARLASTLSGLAVPGRLLAMTRPKLPALALDRLERHFTYQLLHREHACPSVALERALWSAAIQPARNGHGDTRPWHLSEKLNAARAATTVEPPSLSLFAKVGRTSRYLAAIV